MIARLTAAALLPALTAVSICLAERKTVFTRLSYPVKQIIIGLVFGGVAVFAAELGISADGAQINIGSAAPLTAGLLFGGPAGIIAGVIGGGEQWLTLYGGGEYTRLACSLSMLLGGLFAAVMRRYIFEGKRAPWGAGLTIGLTTEVLHMLLVFATNMTDIHTAFAVVQKSAPLTISLSALAVAISLGAAALISGEKRAARGGQRQISQIIRSGLMLCVVIAFAATCVFTTALQVQIAKETTAATLRMGLDEAPRRLQEITDETFLSYANWIAGDIRGREAPDDQFLTELAASYVVPEIFIVAPDGTVIHSNVSSAIGRAVPEDRTLDPRLSERIWEYGAAFTESEAPMQYAAVALEGGEYVLVGYDEGFVAEEAEQRVKALATNTHVGQRGWLMVCDSKGVIVSAGNGSAGRTLSGLGISLVGTAADTTALASLADTPLRLMHRQMKTAAGEYTLIAVLPDSEAVFARNTAVYITAFMEILVFAALFVNVYFLTKRVVVDNIRKINGSLSRIAAGELNEQVNVRESVEFAALTDDINSTVDTLKDYISEAAARIDKELEFAKAIQHSALPSVFPPYPNRRDFDIYALMKTAKEVGGDFYDFYMLDNDRLGFLIADVSGKGIPAAMFMMTAKSVIKGLAESGLEADAIFTQANATLCEGNDACMFVTSWLGILDLRSGLLSFANAGHNPPLLRHKDGGFEFLRTRPNLILAARKKTIYKKHELQLSPGDELFLYTDGVTEATDAGERMFREEGLIAALNKNADEDLESRCKNLLEELDVFVGDEEQFDDITMLSVKLNYLQSFDHIAVCPNMASTDAVWEFIDLRIKAAGLPRKLAAKLRVCADEVYSNILRHSGATKAEIYCRCEEERATLIFRDNGLAYDPTSASLQNAAAALQEGRAGGLGLHIVKQSVSSLDYAYTDGQNVLTLTFRL